MSPYVFVGLNALTLSFNLLVALAALGAPLLVLLLEISAEARSKALYRKTAQHVSRAGLVFIIYFLLVAGAAMGIGFAVPAQADNIVETAKGAGTFGTLLAAAQAAGLADALARACDERRAAGRGGLARPAAHEATPPGFAASRAIKPA